MSTPGRNDPCPCGSGKKYKRCCLHQHEAAAAERAAAAAAQAAAQPPPPGLIWEDDDGLDDASNRVVDLVHTGQIDEAEQAARDLLVRYPEVHDGFERLAMVYEARGDRAQAAEYYRKALAFMEDNADGYDAEGIDWMRKKAQSMEQNP
jgi:tetratricopeptide (TPR) repeat protein